MVDTVWLARRLLHRRSERFSLARLAHFFGTSCDPCHRALPDALARRARHVLTENARVDAMVTALGAGDLPAAGRLLDASHASLRDDYDASVPEVEDAVRACKAAGAAGARMVGGGFGGSVLGLFPPGAGLPAGAVAVVPGPEPEEHP